MLPIQSMTSDRLNKIKFLLTDIDDTLTERGRLPSSSIGAMERLEEAGICVIPITGRPAGWCDHIARMWPVKGVVGENGALYFSYDADKRRMQTVFVKSEAERRADRARLDDIKKRILEEIPGAGIASDQPYRVADLAIDFCEDVTPLDPRDVTRIVALFEEFGATAKISSIHVNGWFGNYDKLSMTKTILKGFFDVDVESDNELIAFIGDSPNDGPMFSFFENSVGVANVMDFSLTDKPKWVTEKRSAHGFREFAELLIAR